MFSQKHKMVWKPGVFPVKTYFIWSCHQAGRQKQAPPPSKQRHVGMYMSEEVKVQTIWNQEDKKINFH